MSPTLQVSTTPAHIHAADPARFIVGRDPDGHWVADEVHGRGGGLFRSLKDAIDYAADQTDRRPDAVLMSAEHVAFPI